MLLNIQESITKLFEDVILYGFNIYKDFLLGLFIGMFFVTVYHKYFGLRYLKKSYERTIESKNEHISDLKVIIGERLSKIKVDKLDSSFFRKLKRYFLRRNL